jgi:hypothetical protein
MKNAEIELIYSALAECIARVGEAKTPLLLATLALDLLGREPDANAALARILQAERLVHV